MKKLLALLLLLLFVASAAAEVQYSIQADENRVLKNTTVSLDCSGSCPGLTWQMAEGETVLGVRDSTGELDYEVSGRTLSIPGRRFSSGEQRVIEIRTRIDRDAEEIHAGLFKRTFQLSGFEGEKTTGAIKSQGLLSGRTGFGFDMSFSGEEMRFRGEGPVNIRVKFGDGYETRYFSFFGGEPSGTEIAYEVPIGTTGVVQSFERFPVAVMDSETYDRKVNEWSAGEYVAGAIQIRSAEAMEGSFLAVLAHEVVHGLNDRKLNWDQTRSTYFDEGTGKYVEFLVHRKLYRDGETDRPPAELFGEKVRYDPDPSDRTYYTISSKGDPAVLWNYYQEDRDFMKTWNAMRSDDPEVRRFGYAYSELVVRNYVARMNGSLRELYRGLDVDRKVSDPDEKWQVYSERMDMTPCDYDSRERFDRCLETINDYDYPVYSAEPNRNDDPLEIRRLEVPERSEQPGTGLTGPGSFTGFVSGFINYILSGIQSLFTGLLS